jgi:beta-glucosidase
VVNGEDGRVACDHYHRWGEDLDLVRDGNFDVYRFSTMWPRVMPDGRTVSAEGLDFYDRLVDGMVERGLSPNLTLYHWDMPSALADLGGWANPDVGKWFADYTEAVIGRIGDRMDAVATINEPWCVAWLAHFLGGHAPGMRDIRAAARAMHHVLVAHARSLEVMRSAGQENLGIVLNFEHSTPASEDEADVLAAKTYDGIYNRWFAGAITGGAYPADILEVLEPHMPQGWQDDMAAISAPIDWLGINYYTRSIHEAVPGAVWPAERAVPGDLPKTAQQWEIYPEGLYGFLMRLQREFTGELPIYVTENGMAGADPGDAGLVDDPARIAYFDAHVGAVKQAIADGAPVKGYFAWSLLDNYEWAFGYDKRFGIVHVNYETQERTPKGSYLAFQRALVRD